MWKRVGRAVLAFTGMTLVAAPAAPASAGGGGGGGIACHQDPSPPSVPTTVVSVSDNCFWPGHVVVNAGEVVQWTKKASYPHTVTFKEWVDVGEIVESLGVRFNEPGRYAYECRYHPGMTGVVSVIGEPRVGPVMEAVPPDDAYPDGLGGVSEATLAAATLPAAGTTTVRLEIDALSGVLLVLTGLSVGAGVSLAVRSTRRT